MQLTYAEMQPLLNHVFGMERTMDGNMWKANIPCSGLMEVGCH